MENNEYPKEYEKTISPPEKILTKICKVGSSRGVVVDKKVLDYLGLDIGDDVHIWVKKA